jgi:hypothetical protein
MAEESSTRYELAPEDAQRLSRLSEEVRGRLTEMVSIIGRIAGDDDFSVGEITAFEPRTAAKSVDDGSGGWMETFEIFGHKGSYGHIGGEWFVQIKG